MDRRVRQIGVVFCLMAMAFFAGWPFWKWIYVRSTTAAVKQRTKALVDKNPQLKAAWDVAMEDGVLTYPEARIIIEASGEKLDSEK